MTAKLKDGLWIGDAQSAQDYDFIDKQCITYFINCGEAQRKSCCYVNLLPFTTFTPSPPQSRPPSA